MSRYVVDASVAIKWFVPEVHGDEAAYLLDVSDQLLAPDLLFPEFANILWKKAWRNEISGTECRGILGDMRRLPLHVYPSQPLLDIALEFAIERRRSVYDSIYVALALTQECRLVTADMRLFNALRASGLDTNIVSIEAVRSHLLS